jgi:hypothetical protein
MVIRWFFAMTSLNVSAIFPATPVQSSGNRVEKSPRLNAIKAASNRLLSHSVRPDRELLAGRARFVVEVFFFMVESGKRRLS